MFLEHFPGDCCAPGHLGGTQSNTRAYYVPTRSLPWECSNAGPDRSPETEVRTEAENGTNLDGTAARMCTQRGAVCREAPPDPVREGSRGI